MIFDKHPRHITPLQERIWRIIFLSDTKAGRQYDLILLALIVLSVALVTLESVPDLAHTHRAGFYIGEIALTGVFSIDYLLRVTVCRRPLRYATSFFGVIDLISILPAYLELLIPGAHFLGILRIVRLVRLFRILKMTDHLADARLLLDSVFHARRKIFVFLVCVMALVFVEGTAMYVIETGKNPDFDSIPQSVYWAIVTITTVGYGDVTPITIAGKMMASVVMLSGFAILAVPTGVLTAEFVKTSPHGPRRICPDCGKADHSREAGYCSHCGHRLPEAE